MKISSMRCLALRCIAVRCFAVPCDAVRCHAIQGLRKLSVMHLLTRVHGDENHVTAKQCGAMLVGALRSKPRAEKFSAGCGLRSASR